MRQMLDGGKQEAHVASREGDLRGGFAEGRAEPGVISSHDHVRASPSANAPRSDTHRAEVHPIDCEATADASAPYEHFLCNHRVVVCATIGLPDTLRYVNRF
jgi:hypothetical protein